MGRRLAGVPAGGVEISLDEYERHKVAYFPILSAGRYRKGVRLVEDDLLFEDVRLCTSSRASSTTATVDSVPADAGRPRVALTV